MIYLAVAGWTFFVVAVVYNRVTSNYSDRLLEQKDNARKLWHTEAKRVADEVLELRGQLTDKENAVADLQAKLDRYKRVQDKRGRFVRAK